MIYGDERESNFKKGKRRFWKKKKWKKFNFPNRNKCFGLANKAYVSEGASFNEYKYYERNRSGKMEENFKVFPAVREKLSQRPRNFSRSENWWVFFFTLHSEKKLGPIFRLSIFRAVKSIIKKTREKHPPPPFTLRLTFPRSRKTIFFIKFFGAETSDKILE